MEYIIVGDVYAQKDGVKLLRNDGCLVLICGKSYENAQASLNRILTNPDENDKKLMKDHENLRIEEVKDEDCWWNFGTD